MCFPMAGAIFSAASGVFGAMQQSAAQKRQAKIFSQQATTERQAAASKARAHRRRGDRLAGTQRALFLTSGVDIAGTPEDVIADSAREVELDAGRIIYGAEINASNLDTKADNLRSSARTTMAAGLLGTLVPIINTKGGRSVLRNAFQ